MRGTNTSIVLFATVLLLTGVSGASALNWDGGASDGLWTSPANWSTNTVPATGDDVSITGGPSFPLGSGWTVNYDFTPNNVTLNSLTISHSNPNLFAASNTLNLNKTGDFNSAITHLTAISEYVGDSTSGGSKGFGIINQTGGSYYNYNTTNLLMLGHNATDAGTYNLSGDGYLSSTVSTIGQAGHGTFNQTGGTYTINNSGATASILTLGDAAGSTGTYNLQAGSLYLFGGTEWNGPGGYNTGGTEIIGNYGTGVFTQTGGSNGAGGTTSIGTIILGNQPGSSGTYNLEGGSLSANSIFLGNINSTFNQSGGDVVLQDSYIASSNTSNHAQLVIGAGSYTLSNNAVLNIVDGAESIGAAGTFTQNGGANIITGGPFGSLQLGSSGSTLVAAYNLNAGLLSLNIGLEYVGFDGTGVFTQAGGNHDVQNITIGDAEVGTAPGTGTYIMSGGALNANSMKVAVGYGGGPAAGTFNQSGGTVTISAPAGSATLEIGYGATGSGSYSLSDTGSLQVTDKEILGDGGGGNGQFTQSGGSNTISSANGSTPQLIIGNDAGSSGTYTLNGGNLGLSKGYEFVGYAGTGAFKQTGGSNDLSDGGTLVVGALNGASGTYIMTDGTLSTPSLGVGGYADGGNGAGTFTQSGGSVSCSTLGIANNFANSSGTYTLNDGSLICTQNIYVGGSGTGTFNQNQGSVQAGASGPVTLWIGYSDTASGNYFLSNGTLSTGGGDEYVGYSGKGTFTQFGGTNTIAGTGLLSLANFIGSSGTYHLAGGKLSAPSTFIRSNGILDYTAGEASLGKLTLSGTGRLVFSSGGGKTLQITSLSIDPTASIDLADNAIRLTYTGASPADAIRNYLIQGFNHGDWKGNGIASSSAAADTHHLVSIGYRDTGSEVLVMYTYGGDANLDGRINIDDYGRIDSNVGITGASGWFNGDFNYDGKINIDDYGIIDGNIGAQGAPIPTIATTPEVGGLTDGITAVPEPVSFCAIALLGAALLQRRRRS